MIILRWLYMLLSVCFIVAAIVTVFRKTEGKVCFPVWIRVGWLLIVGLINWSVAGLFRDILNANVMTYLRLIASATDFCAIVLAVYLCRYGIEIKENGFVFYTLFVRKAVDYDAITDIGVNIEGGIKSFKLTVGKQKITLYRIMHGYGDFLDKLTTEIQLKIII